MGVDLAEGGERGGGEGVGRQRELDLVWDGGWVWGEWVFGLGRVVEGFEFLGGWVFDGVGVGEGVGCFAEDGVAALGKRVNEVLLDPVGQGHA